MTQMTKEEINTGDKKIIRLLLVNSMAVSLVFIATLAICFSFVREFMKAEESLGFLPCVYLTILVAFLGVISLIERIFHQKEKVWVEKINKDYIEKIKKTTEVIESFVLIGKSSDVSKPFFTYACETQQVRVTTKSNGLPRERIVRVEIKRVKDLEEVYMDYHCVDTEGFSVFSVVKEGRYNTVLYIPE